jgi:hypothetical protein
LRQGRDVSHGRVTVSGDDLHEPRSSGTSFGPFGEAGAGDAFAAAALLEEIPFLALELPVEEVAGDLDQPGDVVEDLKVPSSRSSK